MVKRIYQSISGTITTGVLSFTAPYGFAYEIVDIIAKASATGANAIDVVIGQQKMSYLPTSEGATRIVPNPFGTTADWGMYNQLRMAFPAVPRLIVGEGETCSITSVNGVSTVITVVYIEHIGDDKPKNTIPGGSMNTVRFYGVAGRQSTSITNGTTVVLNHTTHVMPPGYITFPFSGAVLPGQVNMVLGAVVQLAATSGADITMSGFRLWRQQENMLTPSQEFCPAAQFPAVSDTNNGTLHLFESPIMFQENETASLDYQVTNAGLAPQNAIVDIVLLTLIIPKGV